MNKERIKTKRGKNMLIVILIIFIIILISLGLFCYLGRSQLLLVKSIENPSSDLYLIRLEKPEDINWEAGSYAQFKLPDIKENDAMSEAMASKESKMQKSRWLTIASTSDENEILILTHNSGSQYKKSLTSLPAGSTVEMSWIGSALSVSDNSNPIVCFASDVGVAAIRPIIKEWVSKREIVFSHFDKGVTIFHDEISKLIGGSTGSVYEVNDSLNQSQETLKNAVNKYGNNASYLLAGQPDDVNEMNKFLKNIGVSNKNIKVERFRGLK